MRRYLLALFIITPALAQDHHQHHNVYQDWSSQKVGSCCNEKDCADLKDADFKQTTDGEFVRIEGQWCPVLPIHRLIRGKSPDWSVAHACIREQQNPDDPCERLLCFSPKGGF